MTSFKNLRGKRFGRLLVLEPLEERKHNRIVWKCLCDCGNEAYATSTGLLEGNNKSCGCLRNEGRPRWLEEGEASFNALYHNYKMGAVKRGLEFSLTKDDFKFLTSEECYLCGTKPKSIIKTKNNNGAYLYNGIDRIDNTKGYTIENSMPCCKDCNFRKGKATLSELFKWAKDIYEYNELQWFDDMASIHRQFGNTPIFEVK